MTQASMVAIVSKHLRPGVCWSSWLSNPKRAQRQGQSHSSPKNILEMSLLALFCALEVEVKASNMELLLSYSHPSRTFTVPRIPREDAGSLLLWTTWHFMSVSCRA